MHFHDSQKDVLSLISNPVTNEALESMWQIQPSEPCISSFYVALLDFIHLSLVTFAAFLILNGHHQEGRGVFTLENIGLCLAYIWFAVIIYDYYLLRTSVTRHNFISARQIIISVRAQRMVPTEKAVNCLLAMISMCAIPISLYYTEHYFSCAIAALLVGMNYSLRAAETAITKNFIEKCDHAYNASQEISSD